jgi:predicted DNA-binding protein with PD1-like motif
MQSKLIHDAEQRTFAVILETGEEAVASLRSFAREHHLGGSQFTAIGAFSGAVVGFFDFDRRDYKRIAIDEQVEVLALLGDIALQDDEPQLHAHVVVGDCRGNARGGHLLEGRVRPTLEVIITESPRDLCKYHDPSTGLALIRL